MSQDKSHDATVVVPLALTDFAKALRELIGAFRDIAGLFSDGINLARRQTASKKAGELDSLGFTPNGMYGSLTRIAEGRNIATDFDRLDQLIYDTASDVDLSIDKLRLYRGAIRRDCGLAMAHKLDVLLDGPSGKFQIRHEIRSLTYDYRRGCPRNVLAAKANDILKLIDQFNTEIIELHDLIYPPRGAPK